MWPLLLDMTEEESIQNLRHLELEAYSSLVSALRAQGSLNHEKRKLLRETGILLSISNERHKAEVRRAISDERLNTIAYHITGQLTSLEDWAQEGRRLVPLLPRVPPQTPYSIIADDASEVAAQHNKQLPLPANTERKRPSTPQAAALTVPVSEPGGKPQIFRIPEVPKDEPKKRKTHSVSENSSLAQHLLSPKLSKIQQIYRQASKTPKPKPKETISETKQKQKEIISETKQKQREFTSETKQKQKEIISETKQKQKEVMSETKQKPNEKISESEIPVAVKSNINSIQGQHMSIPSSYSAPKINLIQNINFPQFKEELVLPEDNVNKQVSNILVSTNENQAPVSKPLNIKSNPTLPSKQSTSTNLSEVDQTIDSAKLCLTKKQINKGQKLIVVSNTQTLPTNSILQKTLSVPMNKLTKLNLEKFKIVPNNQLPSTLQVTNVMNNQHISSSKPKMVTIKGNAGKKVIPLSQLQMLNPKGSLKVIPYSGKMLDKAIPLSNIQSDGTLKKPMVPVNCTNLEDTTRTPNTISISNTTTTQTTCVVSVPTAQAVETEKVKVEYNGIIENGEKTFQDFDMRLDEYHMTQPNGSESELDSNETLSTEESSEASDGASIEDSNMDNMLEMDNCEYMESQQDNEILEEFEVIHSEELLQ